MPLLFQSQHRQLFQMSFNVMEILKSDDVAFFKVKTFIESNPTKLNEIFGSKNRGTLLHYSCVWNRPKVVSYLLSKNADVTKCFISKSKYLREYNGLTALEIAKKLGHDIIDLFNAREEAKKIAILEMLCVTQSYLPNDLMKLVAQTMILTYYLDPLW